MTRAMQTVGVRFGDEHIELIQAEAAHDGISVSQFIREAAYTRAVLSAARRNEVSVVLFERIHEAVAGALREVLRLRESR
jgi:uncharacterized protein (DUF1778 family)